MDSFLVMGTVAFSASTTNGPTSSTDLISFASASVSVNLEALNTVDT